MHDATRLGRLSGEAAEVASIFIITFIRGGKGRSERGDYLFRDSSPSPLLRITFLHFKYLKNTQMAGGK